MVDWAKQKGIDYAYKKLRDAPLGKIANQVECEVGLTYTEMRDSYLADVGTCPDCGEPMAPMGLDFKAPKKGEVEQWTIIKLLYENGFSFHGCGCYVGYAPPNKLKDLPAFFEQHGRKSEGEALLLKFATKD